MKEESNPRSINRSKPTKFADQNHPPKTPTTTITTSSSRLKSASSWGSNIVKGLSGERKTKTKLQTINSTTIPTKNKILEQSNEKSNNNNNRVIKRGLISEISCSVTPAQVHPHGGTNKLTSSRDLFVEIESLRGLLKESKARECQLRGELAECKRNDKVLELEREVEARKAEVRGLLEKVKVLEKEEILLLGGNGSYSGVKGERGGVEKAKSRTVEMELVELRRVNKELQLQKRDLVSKVEALEFQLADFAKVSQNESITKVRAEASSLRRTNEDLSKQVEGLQKSRLNEVEELAYLRWVNSQLRSELRDSCLSSGSDVRTSPHSTPHPAEIRSCSRYARVSDEFLECSSAKRMIAVKKLNRWPVTDEDFSSLESPSQSLVVKRWEELEESSRRHSISGSKCSDEELVIKRRQSDGFICLREVEFKGTDLYSQTSEATKILAPTEVMKRALRVPNPPPRPSCASTSKETGELRTPVAPPPPPPPPPPPRFSAGSTSGAVQRAPEVVEFYHSLMKRDMRRDSIGGAAAESPNISSVRSNMIGEIENRSSYLLAIKADVETQGEFVNSLIREVNNAIYQNIEDIVAFVKWLDDELCFLVDERAVLKHFDWPEKKADTMREAAFAYKDLKKLESEVTYYQDDPRLPCDIALKKMVSLSEKIERSIYNLLRTRDTLMRSCKDFQIPIEWMLDSGIISKVKIGSVKLAKKCMNRVAIELQSRLSLEKDPAMNYMLLQGVRFAFRIHQFAGGFDAETMQAFEELRKLAHCLSK